MMVEVLCGSVGAACVLIGMGHDGRSTFFRITIIFQEKLLCALRIDTMIGKEHFTFSTK